MTMATSYSHRSSDARDRVCLRRLLCGGDCNGSPLAAAPRAGRREHRAGAGGWGAIGPSQIGARLLEAGLMKRFHPMASARLSVALHPLGAALLGGFGAVAASGVFTVLHGAGSGILTIARGTVPLAMSGPENYGYRLGLLGAVSHYDGRHTAALRHSH